MESEKKPKSNIGKYMQYSTMGFQILGFFLVFTFLGKWLDNNHPRENFNFTTIGIFVGLFISLYFLFKPLLKK